MLIKGADLTAEQRKQVLAAFVHRWTHENAQQTYGGRCPACAQRPGGNGEIVIPAGQQSATEVRKLWHDHHVKVVSDQEWLNAHAFHFTKGGTLSARHQYAEPAYLADTEGN